MTSKVIEITSRKDDNPRAPAVRLKLEAAEQALAALEDEAGPLALDEAEGKPGATAKLQALAARIGAAQQERHKLRNALRYATEDDRRTSAAAVAKMRREQFAIFRKFADSRLARLETMFKAFATAAAEYSQYAIETNEMIVALPTGTRMGIAAVGNNGWGGNWVGDLEKLIAGEAFRVAVPDQHGRGARLPFARAPYFHASGDVEAIPPAIDLMREATAAILSDIEAQMERLNREALSAVAKPEAVREAV